MLSKEAIALYPRSIELARWELDFPLTPGDHLSPSRGHLFRVDDLLLPFVASPDMEHASFHFSIYATLKQDPPVYYFIGINADPATMEHNAIVAAEHWQKVLAERMAAVWFMPNLPGVSIDPKERAAEAITQLGRMEPTVLERILAKDVKLAEECRALGWNDAAAVLAKIQDPYLRCPGCDRALEPRLAAEKPPVVRCEGCGSFYDRQRLEWLR